MVTSGPIVGQFVPVAFAALGVGMLGMGLGNLLGDGSDEDEAEDGDDDFFDDDGMDDLGGMDEFDDGLDEGFDDDLGEGDVDELEQRVGELEDELAGISSTVSTVRSENEEISAAVDDIEENVRNLLDIYEMVTRGVNPFVDDVQPGAEVDGGGEFGLFTDDGEDEAEDIDEGVAEADAEEFFDDDLLDDDGEDEDAFAVEDEDPFDRADDGDALDDPDPVDGSSDGGDDDGDDGGGTTFSDLKEEYESGEADWADDVEVGDDADGAAAEPADDEPDAAVEPEREDDPDDGSEALFDGVDDDGQGLLDDGNDGGESIGTGERTDEPADGSATAKSAGGRERPSGADEVASDGDPAVDGSGAASTGASDDAARIGEGDESNGSVDGPAGSAFEFGAVEGREDGSGERPYLPALPAGLRTDATAMAWLSYLVERGGHAGAVEALRYYRRIDWIGPAAEEGLLTLLGGVGAGDAGTAETPAPAETDGGVAGLDPEDHRRSLRYIGRLSDVPVERLLARSGGDGVGVQR